ncbi:unnamed protein product, partial [Heterobilharzia americana]
HSDEIYPNAHHRSSNICQNETYRTFHTESNKFVGQQRTHQIYTDRIKSTMKMEQYVALIDQAYLRTQAVRNK